MSAGVGLTTRCYSWRDGDSFNDAMFFGCRRYINNTKKKEKRRGRIFTTN